MFQRNMSQYIYIYIYIYVNQKVQTHDMMQALWDIERFLVDSTAWGAAKTLARVG